MPYANYFPRGVSMYVATAEYGIDTDMDNRIETLDMGAPVALNTGGLLLTSLQTTLAAVVTAFTATTGTATAIGFNGFVPYNSTSAPVPSGWGRALTMVASVTPCVRPVTITGTDYLGQKMAEVLTANGTTAVAGLKAFMYVDQVSFAAGSDTASYSIGWSNVLGIPFTGEQMVGEIKNGAVAANAGAFTAGLVSTTAANNTSADVRGVYTPATVLPNGTNTFKLMYIKRTGNLHGIAQPPT